MTVDRAVCRRCGAPLPDGARFCPRCGIQIDACEAPGAGVAGPEADRRTVAPPADASYSDRYAGTRWGRPLVPPPALQPAAALPRGFSWLRILVSVVGIFWLLPAVVGIIVAVEIGLAGQFYGVPLDQTLRTALTIGAVINLLWVAFGLKLIIAPGSTSLGCSALLAMANALLFALALGLAIQSQRFTPFAETLLAVPLAVYLAVMLISLLGRTSWE